MLYIGNTKADAAIERMMVAYETSGGRVLMCSPGENVLLDSRPAPGYAPGVMPVAGKPYEPACDGTPIHIYYMAGDKADKRAIAEAARDVKGGGDRREILGRVVSLRRLKKGGVQLMFTARNHDNLTAPTAVSLRSVSTGKGLIVAMALDQTIGLPTHLLAQLATGELIEATGNATISGSLYKARLKHLNSDASFVEGNPEVITEEEATI